MGGKAYVGIDNTSRNIKKCYVGVDGVARKIKKAYVGVNGIARLCYISEVTNCILQCDSATATGSILHAMGIFHGTAYTDWDNLVTAVSGHLGDLGYVTADGNIKLSVLGAGVTMIPGAIISAVRDFLFGSSYISNSSDFIPYSTDSNFTASVNSSYYIPVSSVVDSTYSSPYSSYLARLVNDFSIDFSNYSFISVHFDNHLGFFLSLSNASSLSFTFDSTYNQFHSNSVFRAFSCILDDSNNITSTRRSNSSNECIWTDPFSYYNATRSSSYPCLFGISNLGTLSHGLTSNGDYDTNIAADDGLNSQDNIDVIYPGWATNATNVDTNIDVVADSGTGAIDGVITADKYFPIGIPDLGTSIYDQTQAGAQTGTNAVLLI